MLALPAIVHAQDAGGEAQADDPTGAIGEIVVTAQKREESLQDTPISIVALTAQDLESKRIEGLQDLRANGAPDDPTVVDHIMGVAMSGDQPKMTNIRLDGFFDKRGPGQAR
ncbi:hypothetical protein GRI40_07815 [Altererythrobacter aerius]|uniref:TonB-dependent receptor n=1 Tax=Tsuneonella aeria TaxID=1837929 RepID=A0A6I4TGD1_9SPHN|nr:hypothetical protein [Tsuneonella aeria]MXO75120.1 hypothetical protein [Tsuneonella aeria]